MKVSDKRKTHLNDLFDSNVPHYFVTGGKMRMHISDKNKKISKILKMVIVCGFLHLLSWVYRNWFAIKNF